MRNTSTLFSKSDISVFLKNEIELPMTTFIYHLITNFSHIHNNKQNKYHTTLILSIKYIEINTEDHLKRIKITNLLLHKLQYLMI